MKGQNPVEKCPCWGKTTLVLEIEHCPSLNARIRKEVDRIVDMVRNQSDVVNLGKFHFNIEEAKRIANVENF